jgi:hypothetical protein
MTTRTWSFLAAGALVLAVYLLRLDRVVGLVGDDAWYALLGRTVARGEGYQLANAPTPGLLPAFPPGFALLLAPLWVLAPAFPANVLVLKALPIAAMFAAGVLTYAYSRARTDGSSTLALAVAVATVLVPSLVFLATSTLMSEGVFLVVQLATLVALERWPSRAGTVAAGVGAALTVLIRTMGVALPLGALAYLGVTRQWRRAALFAAAVFVLLAPWQLYAQRHAQPLALRQAQGGVAWSYRESFWMQWGGAPYSGTVTLRGLPARLAVNAVDIVTRDMVALVAPSLLRGPQESGLEILAVGSLGDPGPMGNGDATEALSAGIFLVMVIGWVRALRRRLSAAEFAVPLSLAMIIVWPFWSFRFVLPLAPVLLIYLVDGLRALTPSSRRVPALVIAGVIGLSVVDHAQYIARLRSGEPEWAVYAADTDAVLAWLQQHPADGIIATTNPALVHLRTGAPTIALEGRIDQALKARGVRYVVSVHLAGIPRPANQGLVRYVSPRCAFWVLEL